MGFWLALQFLTRLPLPGPPRSSPWSLRSTLPWFPAVGLVLGAIVAAVDGLLQRVLPPFALSACVVVLLVGLTGALHLDGLMDTADGTLAAVPRERRLEIMRDPRAGSFGVVACVCILALKVAALTAIPAAQRLPALLLVPAAGRWGIVLAARAFPSAKSTGLGAPLHQAASPAVVVVAAVVALAGAIPAPFVGAASLLLASAAALLAGGWVAAQLGGLTGDAYGAVCEVVEAVVLLGYAPLARVLG